MIDVKIRGKESAAVLNRAKTLVRLYFVDVEYAREYANYQNHAFYIRGSAFRLPRLGEYLEVKEVVGLDLINKTRYKGRNILVTMAEGGEQMANLILEAVRSGQALETLDLQKAYTSKAMEKFSDAELLEIMAKRGLAFSPAPTVADILLGDEEVRIANEEIVNKYKAKRP